MYFPIPNSYHTAMLTSETCITLELDAVPDFDLDVVSIGEPVCTWVHGYCGTALA